MLARNPSGDFGIASDCLSWKIHECGRTETAIPCISIPLGRRRDARASGRRRIALPRLFVL
jgi:hypothetical protein